MTRSNTLDQCPILLLKSKINKWAQNEPRRVKPPSQIKTSGFQRLKKIEANLDQQSDPLPAR